MAARGVLMLVFFVLSNVSVGWCETNVENIAETDNAKVGERNANATADQPDPYKDVTWDSVTSKNQDQIQAVTVYSQQTADADFISISSTGKNADAKSDVAVVVPVEKKSKKWFFW